MADNSPAYELPMGEFNFGHTGGKTVCFFYDCELIAELTREGVVLHGPHAEDKAARLFWAEMSKLDPYRPVITALGGKIKELQTTIANHEDERRHWEEAMQEKEREIEEYERLTRSEY